MNYFFHLLTYFGIYATLALSLNIVVGYCGLLTLAHAAYFALGAYTYALLTLKLGWGFIPAVGVGMILAALLSLLISLPSWRLRGDFFIMATLAVQVLLFSAANNWVDTDFPPGSLRNLTNGPFGLTGISKPSIFGYTMRTISANAVASLACTVALGLLSFFLLRSPWGRVLQAMRDDELATRGLGKNVRRLKVQAIAVSCALASVAGAIYAGYVGYVDPSLASLDNSILLLSMVVVGGVGNLRGPLVGAAVLILIPEILRLVSLPDTVAAEVRLMAYGLLLVLMVHLRPQGLAGTYRMQ